jgi:hypothetical protein
MGNVECVRGNGQNVLVAETERRPQVCPDVGERLTLKLTVKGMVWRKLNRVTLGEGGNDFSSSIFKVREFLEYPSGYAAPQLP